METKKYDEDFKQMIVELYENKKPVCEIKSEYGIPDATLYRWIKEYGKIRAETGETTNNHEMKKLKKEEVNLHVYKTFEEAKRTIFEFIESWYNRRRIHSSIGYKTPYELENQKIC